MQSNCTGSRKQDMDLEQDTTGQSYILSLEGGGTRSQIALMDSSGRVLQLKASGDVNVNFTTYDHARQSVVSAVSGVLQASGIPGERVSHLVSALVGPRFGAEVYGDLLPHASYHYFGEMQVVFARSGILDPHGVAIVAGTGATAWAVRADDGRNAVLGGWGSLLGDEGSAYSAGLAGLRAAVRSFEGRDPTPTRLVETLSERLGFTRDEFRSKMIPVIYQKPTTRAEIAQLAPLVTGLAAQGDALALRIVDKVANDLTALALHAARRLFQAPESFTMAVAGGLLNAGELILGPLRRGLKAEFPSAQLIHGKEEPAVALGRLALHNLASLGTP